MKQKLPFGILKDKKLVTKFDKNPKNAAKQYYHNNTETKILNDDLKKYFPYKNFVKWMNKFGISLTKIKINEKNKEEDELIKLTKSYEDCITFLNKLKNRKDALERYEDYKLIYEHLKKITKKLEKEISEITEKIAKNTSYLLGEILTARLITKAKGLEKLAKMPSSKIQILGAEKSLFRYLKENKKDKIPKYGLIYLSPYIQNSKKNKGKIARLLSAKIMLCVRYDFFSGEFKGENIKEEFLEEYKKIVN
ncbi:MAG: hypothetical protein B6U88_00155 [Candidatus Aenigmarchaeota archaeon ex4484_56]|nr:MAG: hypothetical protein B6U88_00155 [Candidatus Aenigmarchaeota archaeon ex4484_56]